MTANIKDLEFANEKDPIKTNKEIPKSYLTLSRAGINKQKFIWRGEIKIEDLMSTDIPVVINSPAYRQRHKTSGALVRRQCQWYTDKTGATRHKKLMGVLRDDELYIVTKQALQKWADIAEESPIILPGIKHAKEVFEKNIQPSFSFMEEAS
jgi:hypothetical protein